MLPSGARGGAEPGRQSCTNTDTVCRTGTGRKKKLHIRPSIFHCITDTYIKDRSRKARCKISVYNIILYKTCRKSTDSKKNFLLLQPVNN